MKKIIKSDKYGILGTATYSNSPDPELEEMVTNMAEKAFEVIERPISNKVFSHKDLVEIGYRWVIKKCGFAFKELTCINNEIADVIGFNSNGTFVLEAKTSKADFLKDKKKSFRKDPSIGMGDWRFFIVPKGLIKVTELPEMWGLIEVNEKGKAINTFNPFGRGNFYGMWRRNSKNKEAEMNLMYSALRRLHLRGRIDEIYQLK
ncbi:MULTISPECIES: hypothetical protein [Elizabethkingia]|uniref:Phage protein n=3 Tax=Elizabethkingia TaxID=308865 RepID=A0A455ZFR1_9FLAO|nr:hypothetical protein [Elizabethkingia anophelis]ATC37747.1 hypothetical protein BAZ09_016520 [Elizabethkingia anophelis R26]ATC41427.1 hypothetical protein EAAG1_016735 [Elizabethkingia anophelis Ag1]ATC45104.1 hypothetical protein CMV41_16735 [Elizabethkingia anophelis]ATC48780.1 hypothetical protein CMV40_16735 [Elizabethkingia anophelis]KMU62268.1 Phage protein [Elizabethkingia anophelis]